MPSFPKASLSLPPESISAKPSAVPPRASPTISWAASLPAAVSNCGSKIATQIVPMIIASAAIRTPTAAFTPCQPVTGIPT